MTKITLKQGARYCTDGNESGGILEFQSAKAAAHSDDAREMLKAEDAQTGGVEGKISSDLDSDFDFDTLKKTKSGLKESKTECSPRTERASRRAGGAGEAAGQAGQAQDPPHRQPAPPPPASS